MSAKETQGICRFCLKSFSGRSMGRHLVSCKTKMEEDTKAITDKSRKDIIYHINISGYKLYWLHIEMNGAKKLSDLDDFLRRIWLECCGHLSEFIIGEERFSCDTPDEHETFSFGFRPPHSMNIQLSKVLQEKDTFTHDYDFGSTTHLKGKVIGIREGYLKEPVKILARNNPLEFHCEKCKKPATALCLKCDEFYCDNCIEKHECGEEMCVEIVNSPRMGVCGYSGEYDFDDFSVSSQIEC